jgi:hypothetical protein
VFEVEIFPSSLPEFLIPSATYEESKRIYEHLVETDKLIG